MPLPTTQLTRRLAIVAALASPLAGCGRFAGLGYFGGLGRGTKIEPIYTLPDNTLLILVDDPGEKVRSPRTRDQLARDLGEELLAHKAVSKIVRPDALAKLRRMDAQFESYPATAVGRKLDAGTVLFLEVREYFAPLDIEDTSTAAKLTVAVRVLNVHESKRADKVRLWPTDEGGHIVESELRAVEVHKLASEAAVAGELARKCALHVGRLFYQHTLGDLDEEP